MDFTRTPFSPTSPSRFRRSPRPFPSTQLQMSETVLDMHEIKQEHYYIEKLRQQRLRMELFKEEFQRKDVLINTQEKEIERLKQANSEQISRANKRAALLESENQVLLRDRQDLVIKLKADAQEIDTYKAELNNAAHFISERDIEMDSLRYQVGGYHQINTELKDHLDCLVRQHDHAFRQLQRELTLVKTQCQESKEELDLVIRENTTLKQYNIDFQHQLQKRARTIQGLRRQNQVLRDEVEVDKVELDRVLDTVNSYKSMSDLRQHQYAVSVQTDLEKANSKIHKLTKALKSYKQKIKQHDSCVKQFIDQIKQLKQKVDKLSDQCRSHLSLIHKYKALESRQLGLTQQLKRELKEKESLKGPEQRLRGELQRLRHELYVLRSAEVDKMQKVFDSFTGQK